MPSNNTDFFPQVYEGLKPSDKFEKTLDYRYNSPCLYIPNTPHNPTRDMIPSRPPSGITRSVTSSSLVCGSSGGPLGTISGGSASSSQKASSTKGAASGTVWRTCLRSCAPARESAPCLCRSSRAHPTRYAASRPCTFYFYFFFLCRLFSWKTPQTTYFR